MSQINLKSISGITSITTPAGVDNVFTVHSNDTTERFRVDSNGNQVIAGILTVSQDLDVDGHTNLDNVSIAGVTTFASTIVGSNATFSGNINNSPVGNGSISGFGAITIQAPTPALNFTETDANPDYRIIVLGGQFRIQDVTNSNANRFIINTDGTTSIEKNLNCLSDLDVDGHTNLDNVSIAGVTTTGNLSGSNANFTGELTVAEMVGHTGDTHTKLSFPANDTIAFTTGGTERLRITSTGDIYIRKAETGASKGSAALEFYGTTSGSLDRDQAKIESSPHTANTNAGNLDFYTQTVVGNNLSLRMRIDGGGNIGINESANINGRLHIQHDALNENILYATRYNDQSNDKPILAVTEASMTGMTASGLVIGTHNRGIHIGPVFDSSAAVQTAYKTGIRIAYTGNVGINSAMPAQKLDVDGIIRGSSYFQAGSNTTASNNWHFGAEGNGQFRIYSGNYGAGAEKLRIDADGVIFTGDYGTRLDPTPGSVQINGGSSGGRLSLRGTTTSAYGGIGEMHGFWDTNKVASILFHAGSDTTNKDDGEIRMYTRPSGGSSAQRFRIDANGNVIFGSAGTYASNTVSIHPSSGMVNFGMDGRDALITGENSCYIFSGSGASGDMPAGSLILQSRANVNRNIFFATGATPSLKWQIHGSTGALQEFPYNTSTSSQLTSTGNGYHLRRVRNGIVPTGNSGDTKTLFLTSDIGDAGAYIMVIRSFEQSVTGGNLWSVRMVTSPFYVHSGSGNDGESVLIPYTYSGHANNATTQSSNGQGPITLRIHFYNGSAHTTGRIRITFNGFNYTGSNCDYYLYKLIDV